MQVVEKFYETRNEIYVAQTIANVQKIETKPIEYTKQLQRILTLDPMLTSKDLAKQLGKSSQWLDDRLSLKSITDENIKALVNDGAIKLSNAYLLAKLPTPEEQADYADRAITMPYDEFGPLISTRLKEIRKANAKGKDAAPTEWKPTPKLRKQKAMKAEAGLEEGVEGFTNITVVIKGITDPFEAAKMAILWTLQLDPASVEKAKAEEEARKAARAGDKKAKSAERAKLMEAKQKLKSEHAAKVAKDAVDALKGLITDEEATANKAKYDADLKEAMAELTKKKDKE
jgi:hypothetical protein